MSAENIHPYSTISDSLDSSMYNGINGEQYNQSNYYGVGQTHVDNDTHSNFTDLTSISQNSDEARKKILSRWDDCLSKKLQTKSLANQQNFSADQKTIVQPTIDKLVVREFSPRTIRDPILAILRELFVRSFDQFYQEIEAELKLKTGETLVEWLQVTFDDMQDEIVKKKCRCFMLCSSDDPIENDNKQRIIGFLTLKEEDKGSVYIAQCAIEAESKRRGYGARLLQHLRTIYPPGTFYWGLCRRVNKPAVNFYLKQGATFIDDNEIATKYDYDPVLYTGFQFTDGIGSFQSSATDASILPPTSSTKAPSPELVERRRSHTIHRDNSTMTDPLLHVKKSSLCKGKSCCVIL